MGAAPNLQRVIPIARHGFSIGYRQVRLLSAVA
jgi:hypothetical protein